MSENTRRLKECVEAWPECAEGEYDPRCCRFPKSCSCDIIHNQALLDDPKWCEENLEPERRITSNGPGVSLGGTDEVYNVRLVQNPTDGSVRIELADNVRDEIQKLRTHYIDAEQLLALRTWQAVNPGDDPHALALADWRIAAMGKWEAEYPQLAALLGSAGASHE